MAAHKAPVARSVEEYDRHIFAADVNGARDVISREPIECLHCKFPRANAVHVSSEELVAGLEPNPIAEDDARIIGEGG